MYEIKVAKKITFQYKKPMLLYYKNNTFRVIKKYVKHKL